MLKSSIIWKFEYIEITRVLVKFVLSSLLMLFAFIT